MKLFWIRFAIQKIGSANDSDLEQKISFKFSIVSPYEDVPGRFLMKYSFFPDVGHLCKGLRRDWKSGDSPLFFPVGELTEFGSRFVLVEAKFEHFSLLVEREKARPGTLLSKMTQVHVDAVGAKQMNQGISSAFFTRRTIKAMKIVLDGIDTRGTRIRWLC